MCPKGIDTFVNELISGYRAAVPDSAQVLVTCEQQEVVQGNRYFELNVVYVENGKEKEIYTTGVYIDRGDELPNHAASIRNMFAAQGIPSELGEGRIKINGKDLFARIIELDMKNFSPGFN